MGRHGKDTAFDKRIAFISIDNAVEVSVRSFLGLPRALSGQAMPSRAELQQAGKSFPQLLSLSGKYAKDKLVGMEVADIEFYHRIRNTLYHEGTALSVDEERLEAYFAIARLLVERLFGVKYDMDPQLSLGQGVIRDVINAWSPVEGFMGLIFHRFKVDPSDPRRWETLVRKGVLTREDVRQFRELKSQRNAVVHSPEVHLNHARATADACLRLSDRLHGIYGEMKKETKALS
jgi:hypothetical protein